MGKFEYLQFIIFIVVLFLSVKPVGIFLARVFEGEKHLFSKPLGWLEKLAYRIAGLDPRVQMSWKQYAWALMIFNCFGIGIVFLIQILQNHLPLNPQNLTSVPWDLALNTAVSFVTNTNWQAYSPENTMSYLTQMLALIVQNFLSAAVGIAVAIALTRGIAARTSENRSGSLGNFWADITRATVYVFLPACVLYTLFLISQGVVQNFSNYVSTVGLEGLKQVIPMGPAASQVAIKMLGTNGGGFFNANAAHPFENPTALSNFIQMLSIFILPAGLTYTYGLMTKNQRHGWVIFGTMLTLFILFTGLSLWSEYSTNPIFSNSAVMEGKETRFGAFGSILFSTITTSASCGAVNAMHSSLSPLSGGIALFNILLGEIVFGGVGAGLYGMLMFVLLTVFISGLMVGRTPEYLGKKIEAREMSWVLMAVLAPCAVILLGTGISVVLPQALSSIANKGPHGLTEILYAFASAAGNNGSAFAGLSANTLYFNLALAVAMFIGRFAVIIPALGIAGSLAEKKYSPPSVGTFDVNTSIFAILLIGVILIVGALTFVPALSLGPIIEHLLMLKGITF